MEPMLPDTVRAGRLNLALSVDGLGRLQRKSELGTGSIPGSRLETWVIGLAFDFSYIK
jgi:hypothetical protein